jgi:hypothetical protein
MDVESLDTLKAAVDHLNSTTIPALEASLGRVLAQASAEASALADRTTTELSNILSGAAQSIQAIMDKGLAQIAAQVNRIDGASVRLGDAPKGDAPNAG